MRRMMMRSIASTTMPLCRRSSFPSRRLVSSSISVTQHKLLQASLAHVATHGWTQDAIVAAVREHKLPLTMIGLVTPTQLVESFMDDCNEQFKQQLQLQLQLQPHQPLATATDSSTTTNARLASAIQRRLEYILPYKHHWHQGMALGATNMKTPEQLKEMVQLVADHVYGPNNSTLFERAAIGAIYVVTELHFLADDSPDHSKTWEFLRQRVIQGTTTAAAAARGGISSLASPKTIVAATAIASSLVGAVGSLAHPAMQGLYSSALPVMMNWITPPTSPLYQQDQTIQGTSPTDYDDLPPFPSATAAK